MKFFLRSEDGENTTSAHSSIIEENVIESAVAINSENKDLSIGSEGSQTPESSLKP